MNSGPLTCIGVAPMSNEHDDLFDRADAFLGGANPDRAETDDDPFTQALERATAEPDTIVLRLLQDRAALRVFGAAAAKNPPALESFVLMLRELPIPRGDIDRLERSIKKSMPVRERVTSTRSPNGSLSMPFVVQSLPHAPVSPLAIVPHGYAVDDSGVLYEAEDADGAPTTSIVANSPTVVVGRLVDVDDGSESLRIAWRRDGRWRERTSARKTLADTRGIVELADYGFPVNSATARGLVQYVTAYEGANLDVIPKARVSRSLGWQGKDCADGFLWGRRLLAPGGDDIGELDLDAMAPADWREDWIAFHGRDGGDAQFADGFRTEGSLDAWRDGVAVVQDHPRVAFGLYAALAAPLLEIIRSPNFVVDWCNPTTTGKTTVLRLAGSVWGNPNEQASDTIMGNWNSTRVWVERAAALMNGLPLLMDDTKQAKNPKQVGQAIYDLVSGHGRGRGSLDGMRRSGSWRTVLLSTGEAPATSFSEDGGTRTRALTLWGAPFGAADETTIPIVNRLNLVTTTNYGHAGPIFVRHLLAHRDGWDAWRGAYQAIHARYIDLAGVNVYAARLAAVFAIIDLAATLAHDALALPWPATDPIASLWDDIVHEADDADVAMRALQAISSWINANETAFFGRHQVIYGDPKVPHDGWAGRWDQSSSWTEISFYPHRLESILTELGFDPAAALRSWRDRGWLNTEQDRLTRLTRIDGNRVRLIPIQRDAIEAIEPE